MTATLHNSNHSALIALRSAVTVDLDNGGEQASTRLMEPDSALIVTADPAATEAGSDWWRQMDVQLSGSRP